ncbi:MAG: PEBP family protein [Sandaracinaceae bacterium]
MHSPLRWITAGCLLAFAGCSGTTVEMDAATPEDASSGDDADTSGATTYLAEVWADNWSSMYVDGELVMEDSVSITTERSFNEEVFTFEATPPFQMSVVLKDFIEDDTGLEYIGTGRQQMGDGGYIAQITNMSTGALAMVSSADWRCTTIHEAPLETSCESASAPTVESCGATISEEPDGWRGAGFDDSDWAAASVFTAAEVDPKQGYDAVTWDPSAQFIWGPNLQTHNTVLCRVTVP